MCETKLVEDEVECDIQLRRLFQLDREVLDLMYKETGPELIGEAI